MFALRKSAANTQAINYDLIAAILDNVSTNLMAVDNDLNIVYANDAVISFLRSVEADLKKALPHFDANNLMGKNIDIFHKNPSHQRGMLAKLAQPYLTSIRVGGHVFNLRAFPIFDRNKNRIGSVVEWFDSKIMDNESQMKAVNKAQAVIEFNLDGTIIKANDNFLNTLGYRLDEVQGKHHSMFVDPAEVAQPAYRQFWDALGRGEYQAAQYKRFGKGGKEVWIQASYNPIFDLNGKPYKVVKFATDISKQIEMIGNVQKLVETNLTAIGNAVGTVEQQATSASSGATETTANVQAVASGAEELHASVMEISQTMTKSKSEADDAFNKVVAADAETRKLADAARAMNGIVELIQDIANQVNLLSLNATIEAARAGEAGKGFAVVATEVKNLAGQASEATNKIADEISGIQSVVGNVVQALEAIQASIDSVRAYVTGVAGAVEEQSAVAKDMSSNMQSASQAVNEVSSSLAQIVNAVGTVTRAVDDTNKAAAALTK